MSGAFYGRDFDGSLAEDTVALFTGFKGSASAVREGIATVSFFKGVDFFGFYEEHLYPFVCCELL